MANFHFSTKPLHAIFKPLMQIAALPYYRLYNFNTLQPIRLIAAYASDPTKSGRLERVIALWTAHKVAELQFISIAAAVLATIISGSFSWTGIDDAYWLAPTLWYPGLVLSIFAILISAQQISVLNHLSIPDHSKTGFFSTDAFPSKKNTQRLLPLLLAKEPRPGTKSALPSDEKVRRIWRPRWRMLFVWQCPIMFLSYSSVFYLVGLTFFVCSPWIKGHGRPSKIIILYFVITFIILCAFVFCSFWIYHYIELEDELSDAQQETPELFLKDRGTQTDSDWAP